MEIEVKLDLDSMWTDPEWGTTVAGLVRDELRLLIKAEVRKAIKADPGLKRAINLLTDKAAKDILKAVSVDG